MVSIEADALLAGPRGRRLCLEVATACAGFPTALSTALFWADYWAHESSSVLFSFDGGEPIPEQAASDSEVAALIDAMDLTNAVDVLPQALRDTVDRAAYWQPADGRDDLAAMPVVRRALERVVARIVEMPWTQWWASPVALDDQWQVQFEGVPKPDQATAVTDRLARWSTSTREEERRAGQDRPSDPAANWGGTWWSRPPRDLVTTCRSLPESGPVRLTLVEDRLAWTRATATAIRTPTNPRMYEIDGPDAWVELCRQHPLELTASRRHEWYRTTGRNGPWIIPDWAAVGREYDGVHLTVAGYLSTAGRSLAVVDPSSADPSGSTMATILAGWDPDVTYWFVDLPEVAGAVTEWREGEDGRWQR